MAELDSELILQLSIRMKQHGVSLISEKEVKIEDGKRVVLTYEG